MKHRQQQVARMDLVRRVDLLVPTCETTTRGRLPVILIRYESAAVICNVTFQIETNLFGLRSLSFGYAT
jgi:hypothetical protein